MTISSPTPEREALLALIKEARQHVCDIAAGRKRWIMCVPVRNDDSDMLIFRALDRALDAIADATQPTPPATLTRAQRDAIEDALEWYMNQSCTLVNRDDSTEPCDDCGAECGVLCNEDCNRSSRAAHRDTLRAMLEDSPPKPPAEISEGEVQRCMRQFNDAAMQKYSAIRLRGYDDGFCLRAALAEFLKGRK